MEFKLEKYEDDRKYEVLPPARDWDEALEEIMDILEDLKPPYTNVGLAYGLTEFKRSRFVSHVEAGTPFGIISAEVTAEDLEYDKARISQETAKQLFRSFINKQMTRLVNDLKAQGYTAVPMKGVGQTATGEPSFERSFLVLPSAQNKKLKYDRQDYAQLDDLLERLSKKYYQHYYVVRDEEKIYLKGVQQGCLKKIEVNLGQGVNAILLSPQNCTYAVVATWNYTSFTPDEFIGSHGDNDNLMYTQKQIRDLDPEVHADLIKKVYFYYSKLKGGAFQFQSTQARQQLGLKARENKEERFKLYILQFNPQYERSFMTGMGLQAERQRNPWYFKVLDFLTEAPSTRMEYSLSKASVHKYRQR